MSVPFSLLLITVVIVPSRGIDAASLVVDPEPFQIAVDYVPAVLEVAPEICRSGFAHHASFQGESPLLGSYTGRMFACVEPETLDVFDGRFAIDADFGQQVIGTYQLDLVNRSEERISMSGSFVITGGTGRFHTASGGGVLSGEMEVAALQGTWLLDGRITPGSTHVAGRQVVPVSEENGAVDNDLQLCDATLEHKGVVRRHCN
jgi:hypothetical protein